MGGWEELRKREERSSRDSTPEVVFGVALVALTLYTRNAQGRWEKQIKEWIRSEALASLKRPSLRLVASDEFRSRTRPLVEIWVQKIHNSLVSTIRPQVCVWDGFSLRKWPRPSYNVYV